MVSEQSDAKTATIDELEQAVQKLTEDNKELSDELAAYQGSSGASKASDGLMKAVRAYIENPDDIETIATYLEELEENEAADGEEQEEVQKSEAFTALYNKLIETVGADLAAHYYDSGYSSYRAEDYEAAIPDLQRAYEYDETNGDALFNLANSYRRSNDEVKAKEVYAMVIDHFPGTELANRSETSLAEINNAE